MKILIVILFPFLLLPGLLKANSPQDPLYSNAAPGPVASANDSLSSSPIDSIISRLIKLPVYSDEKLTSLVEIFCEENLRKGGVDGFRVQIFTGSKDEAYRMKSMFVARHPDVDAHVLFLTPDFYVRVGDFRTRSEAIRFKHKIAGEFPDPFIVEDVIHYPNMDNAGVTTEGKE